MNISSNQDNYFYLGFNRKYINPWTDQILKIFQQTRNITKCGPGFKKDIQFFLSNMNKCDCLVVDSLILESEKFLNSRRPFGSSSYDGDMKGFKSDLLQMRKIFEGFKKKIIFIANLDYYSASKDLTKYISENNIYVISMSDFNTTFKHDEANKSEMKINYAKSTNNWFNLVNERKDLIISCPHFIDSNEFSTRKLSDKNFYFDIPGVMYEDRANAKKYLNLTGRLRHSYYEIKRNLIFLVNRLQGKLSLDRINKLNRQFLNRIRNTKFVYTCGSMMKFPVRKFFEIPSQSSVLVCDKFYGMNHLGFKESDNFISIEQFQKNSPMKNYQMISESGYKLIKFYHSSDARLEQLSKCFNLIENQKFLGSYWLESKYVS